MLAVFGAKAGEAVSNVYIVFFFFLRVETARCVAVNQKESGCVQICKEIACTQLASSPFALEAERVCGGCTEPNGCTCTKAALSLLALASGLV